MEVMRETYCKSDKELQRSHERCKKLGIQKNQVFSKKIICDTELQKKFTFNRNLILTAEPYIENLMNFVRGSNFFILLTDKEGCILNAIGDEKILSKSFSMKMIPGAFMNEENIGTNAMSMVIKNNKPIQISGNQHFIYEYHKWTCSAAPIRDRYGNLIAVLDLTGYIESVHSHTLGMVIAASNAVEEMLKIKEYEIINNINNKYKKTVFNFIPMPIITSDADGKIEICNEKALSILGNNRVKVSGMKDIIENWINVKKDIYLGKSVSEEVNIHVSKNRVRCHLTANPIYNSEKNAIEIIYVFEGIKDIKRKNNDQAYYTFDKILGEDENFIKVIEYSKKISGSKSTILIIGESGTGKELFAQSIHNYSSRSEGPFIALNCGAIPEQLMESELFGYEEGSFTGAKKGGNPGKFELADGGTIMLDEIGEMPLDMQTKLLRVVQEGVITKIGSSRSIPIDVRIIAVTNKDLKKEVELGRFRKDLYYRLNVLPIYLPPLRERKSDIILLVKHFMSSISKKLGKKDFIISEEYLRKMIKYDWPGNIRELKNVVELIVNSGGIPANYFGEEECDDKIILDINDECLKLDYIEKLHLAKVLRRFKGNITHSADALGIRRNTLYNKIKKYNISM
ncbi:sigma-54-dependent Fis family transcriptional regulator [Clostridium sp. Mt-5]|uniref:Sigma-54-dependent Fis family transcriptional regulator n=2 Tax=Clostridium moutaii TaxID=3240932 RepID=A0ABV4BQN5_9CLOT